MNSNLPNRLITAVLPAAVIAEQDPIISTVPYWTSGFAVSPGSDEDVNILFVEDDPANADTYKLKLELDGYRVIVVHAGGQALDVARSARPDIVYVQVQPSSLAGITLLRELRADGITRNLPVIVISAYSEKELADLGLQLGALDYLIKSECKERLRGRERDE